MAAAPEVVTDAEKLAEVEREIAFRHAVYRKRIKAGTMTVGNASKKIRVMEAIAADYRERLAAQPDLFATGRTTT